MIKKLLGALVCASVVSANASAGLIHFSTDWSIGRIQGENYGDISRGKMSYYYEEGTNTISSLIIFDQDHKALFSSLGSFDVRWPHEMRPRNFWGSMVDRDGVDFIDLRTGGLLDFSFSELHAYPKEVGVYPTLDDYNGYFWLGSIGNDDWRMSFSSSGTGAVRETVSATVPEPAPMALFAASLALFGLGRYRARRV